MKIKNTLMNKLIISIFIGCLIPYIVGGLYLKGFMEKWLYDDNLEKTNKLLLQVSERIDKSLIESVEEVVTMLSEADLVKQVDGSINNYTEYDVDQFVYKETDWEKQIREYFSNVYTSHGSANFVFFGTEEGGYIEFPKFKPKGPYDPRQRPWYINTIDSEAINISDPYITQVTKEVILSFTRKVTQGNKNVGVIGISVKIEDLIQSIGSISLGGGGYIVVLNSNDKIIISPREPEWLLKTPEELNLSLLTDLTSKVGKSYEGRLNDEVKVINTYISLRSGWKVVSILPKQEIIRKSNEMTNILIVIYFLTMVIIFVVVVFISRKITEPILRISKIIDRMAAFDLKVYNRSYMDAYSQKNDEVGIIAKALRGMEGNYIELSNTIHEMDNEINNIDIKKDTKVKLTLSENNPFNGVTQSFNVLLDKVHTYFEQLKESNREIFEKNQLLTTSEEELMAQLEENDAQREYINFLAFHDPLTNLPNRRQFIEMLESALKLGTRGAVILLDLDNFKSINDTMGHVYGDKVLMGVSKRLEAIVEDNVFVSRFGGDEFLILLKSEDNLERVKLLVDKIIHIFKEKLTIDEYEVTIAFSMGISLFPQDSQEVNQLIMNADLALYAVKDLGKDGYKFFDASMAEHLLRRSVIESIILEALDHDGFKMVYQPQVNLLTGEVHAYEALLRLKDHPISPAEFIPIAEETGAIIKIGRIVTQKVIEQLSIWQSQGYEVKPISINFSASQLHDTNYLQFIIDELDAHKVKPENIEIEITENIFLDNRDQTLSFLMKLKETGMKISIDDFGTGYSSLSYLTYLPIDKIKFDRSLSIKFLEIESMKVMDSLILLAHSLNLEVVAEGIETFEQFSRLRAGKCDYIQGYYFSKPLEVEAVENNFSRNYYEGKQ